MKRVSFFMMAAIIAASSVFVSCNKDDDPYIPKDAPEISVKFGGADVAKNATVILKIGAKKTIDVSFVTEGGLKAIEFSIGTESPGVPVTPGATSGTFSIELEGIVKGNIPIAIKVTDNQAAASEGLPEAIGDLSDTFSFTVGVEENELEEVNFEFTWERIGGTAATGLTKYGLDWFQSAGTPLAAHIRIIAGSGNEWYKFDNTVYNAVTTKEGLKALFTDDKKQTGNFTEVNFSTKTYNIVIGTKVVKATGDEYHLINITASNEVIINAGTPTESVRRTITGRSKL